jgi:hypothetical protein
MTRRRTTLLILMPLLLALGPLCVLALVPGSASAAPAAAAGSLTQEQVVKMAEKKFHARVVKVETQKEGGKSIYVLRLLNEAGHVRTVRVDAVTGAVE